MVEALLFDDSTFSVFIGDKLVFVSTNDWKVFSVMSFATKAAFCVELHPGLINLYQFIKLLHFPPPIYCCTYCSIYSDGYVIITLNICNFKVGIHPTQVGFSF